MGRLWAAVLAVLVGIGACAAPAAAKPRPARSVIAYGDSLIWESAAVITRVVQAKPGWTAVVHAAVGQAPCDWLARLATDVATSHPSVIAIGTAGNSDDCMTDPSTGEPWPQGSDGYYNQYRSDLNAFFAQASAAATRVLFIEDPPVAAAPVWDASLRGVISIAVALAASYPNVSLVTATRTKLAKHHGSLFVSQKACLRSETFADGCVNRLIHIRSFDGLHLCWPALTRDGCPSYSSGEERYGTAIAKAIVHS